MSCLTVCLLLMDNNWHKGNICGRATDEMTDVACVSQWVIVLR